MIEAIADIPPIVMADLFGIQPHTANRWAQMVSESWSHYLTSPQITPSPGPGSTFVPTPGARAGDRAPPCTRQRPLWGQHVPVCDDRSG